MRTMASPMQWIFIMYSVVNCFQWDFGEAALPLSACPADYSEYSSLTGMCYRPFLEEHNRIDARQRCQSDGADLPVIHDLNTNLDIQRLSRLWLLNNIWIGLSRVGGTLSFTWFDGNPMIFSQWNSESPAENVFEGRDCGAFDASKWIDTKCSMLKMFLCQKRASIFLTCPSGYAFNAVRNACIKITNDYLTWQAARKVCISDGGDLARVPDTLSYDFLNTLSPDVIRAWVSASDLTQWIDNTQSEIEEMGNAFLDFTRYRRSAAGCDAVILKGDDLFLSWRTFECTYELPFICEKEVYQPVFCPGGDWIKNPRNQRCYKIFESHKTWSESRAQCEEEGGGLVTMTDSFTEDYIRDLGIPNLTQHTRYWVGYQDWYRSNIFTWLDGSLVVTQKRTEFDTPDQQCGTIELRKSGQFVVNLVYTDYYCDRTLPFICQKDAFKDYPVMTCPHGYTTFTYVTTVGTGTHIVCLRAEHDTPMTYWEAAQTCQNDGAILYHPDADKEPDVISFVDENIIAGQNDYWAQVLDTGNCITYEVGNISPFPTPCEDQAYFVCRHMGSIQIMMNIGEVILTNDVVSLNSNSAVSTESLTDICKFPTIIGDFINLHDPMLGTSIWAVGEMSADWNYLLDRDNHRECFGTPSQILECCSEVILSNGIETDGQVNIQIQFPVDKVHCVCPIESTTSLDVFSTASHDTVDFYTVSETIAESDDIATDSQTTDGMTRDSTSAFESTTPSTDIYASFESTPPASDNYKYASSTDMSTAFISSTPAEGIFVSFISTAPTNGTYTTFINTAEISEINTVINTTPFETTAPTDVNTTPFETTAPTDVNTTPFETTAPTAVNTTPFETMATIDVNTIPFETTPPTDVNITPTALTDVNTIPFETTATTEINTTPFKSTAPVNVNTTPFETTAATDLNTTPFETTPPTDVNITPTALTDVNTIPFETTATTEINTTPFKSTAPVDVNTTPFETAAPTEINTTPFETTATTAVNPTPTVPIDVNTAPFETTTTPAIPDYSRTNNLVTTTPPPPPPPRPPYQDPTPITPEIVKTLRNMTSLQNTNGSNPPPTILCPCSCEAKKFDPNPSPEVLHVILTKIKNELKVDSDHLSKTRNKKISAVDSRPASQTIGYISAVFCLIPFGVIVGTDLIRLFQYFGDKGKISKPLQGIEPGIDSDQTAAGSVRVDPGTDIPDLGAAEV